MKKIAMLLALVLLASVPALGEIADEVRALEGIVVDVAPGEGFLLETLEFGDVQVNVSDETNWDINFDLAPGAFVYVDYDGAMTRSLPPQVFAQGVRAQLLKGAVIEIAEDGKSFLLESGEAGMVVVHLPEDRETEFRGNAARVYFDGIMLLSYPGQINAALVLTGSAIEGAVAQIAEDHIIVSNAEGDMRVNVSDAALFEGLAEGDYVRAFFEGIPESIDGAMPVVISTEIVKLNR